MKQEKGTSILTPEFVDQLIRDHGPGLVEIVECPICGRFEWVSTRKADSATGEPFPNSISIRLRRPNFDDPPCMRCTIVHDRAPEVFRWVLGVIDRATRPKREESCDRCGGSGEVLFFNERPGGPPGNQLIHCPKCKNG